MYKVEFLLFWIGGWVGGWSKHLQIQRADSEVKNDLDKNTEKNVEDNLFFNTDTDNDMVGESEVVKDKKHYLSGARRVKLKTCRFIKMRC